jgi:hypothetical protein
VIINKEGQVKLALGRMRAGNKALVLLSEK